MTTQPGRTPPAGHHTRKTHIMDNHPMDNTPGAYVAVFLATKTETNLQPLEHSGRFSACHTRKVLYLTGLEGTKQLTDNPATAMTYSSTEAAKAALAESGLPFGTVTRNSAHTFEETTYTGGAAPLVHAIEYHRMLTLKGSIK